MLLNLFLNHQYVFFKDVDKNTITVISYT